MKTLLVSPGYYQIKLPNQTLVTLQCTCASVKVIESDTIDSWIRVKGRAENAGGLKVRALTWTVRDAGSSPAWCSKQLCSNFVKSIVFSQNS